MGSRGPQPKHPARRQRANAPVGLTVLAGGLDDAPPAHGRWFKATRVSWESFWSSDVARAVVPSDVEALYRLWHLRDQWERARRIVVRQPLVDGSQGQPVENPLAKRMDRIAGEIRQLEDRFGLTPSARARLNLTFGDAARSIDQLTRGWADDDDDDATRIIDV